MVLRLESSSKWPDELEAVRSTGTAFLIRLAQCLERKVRRIESFDMVAELMLMLMLMLLLCARTLGSPFPSRRCHPFPLPKPPHEDGQEASTEVHGYMYAGDLDGSMAQRSTRILGIQVALLLFRTSTSPRSCLC